MPSLRPPPLPPPPLSRRTHPWRSRAAVLSITTSKTTFQHDIRQTGFSKQQLEAFWSVSFFSFLFLFLSIPLAVPILTFCPLPLSLLYPSPGEKSVPRELKEVVGFFFFSFSLLFGTSWMRMDVAEAGTSLPGIRLRNQAKQVMPNQKKVKARRKRRKELVLIQICLFGGLLLVVKGFSSLAENSGEKSAFAEFALSEPSL